MRPRPPQESWKHPALWLGAALALACSPPASPNVVLVTFDTTRADRIGAMGDAAARTPHVDALAARGLVFEHAYASAPLTLPSHTTMLTGLEPITHGVHHNGKFQVAQEIETLAEILGAAGYDTGAFVSAFVLDPRYDLDQGFDVYRAETRRVSDFASTVPQRSGREVTDEALAWLGERPPDAPFFLWAHYYDPHHPRRVEPPFDAMPDPYRAEIAYADAALGRLLEGIAAAENGRETLVVFTADHGESLGEHGEETHGAVAYDASLHVPLVLTGPGVPRGERREDLARHVDLLPTLLAAVGLPARAELPGRDLLAMTSDEGVVGYFECEGAHWNLGWERIRGVRTRDWKFTAMPEPRELYDLRSDPDERRNRASEHPEQVERMTALYEAWTEEWERTELARPRVATGVEELEALAALGYVDESAAPAEPADPRRLVAVLRWIDQARSMAHAGAFQRAIDVLATLADHPALSGRALRELAAVYEQAGRFDEAADAYARYAQETRSLEGELGRVRSLVRAGRHEEALERLAAAPQDSQAFARVRATALSSLGRHAEARNALDASVRTPRGRARARSLLVLANAPVPDGEAELRRLVAERPGDPALRSRLGYYLAVWGGEEQRSEALALLRAAARERRDEPELQANLGWGAHRLGFHAEAQDALEAALALDGLRHRDRVRLARVLAERGETERARELVDEALAGHPAEPWSDEARALAEDLQGPADVAAGGGS